MRFSRRATLGSRCERCKWSGGGRERKLGLDVTIGIGRGRRLAGRRRILAAAAAKRHAEGDCAGRVQQRARHHQAAHEHEGRERSDHDGRQLLRISRHARDRGARNHPRVGRRGIEGAARAGLAVFGEIRFQQIALRFGLPLERAQLHVVLVGGDRLALELVEGHELGGDAGVGELGVVLERARQDLGLFPDLLVEVGDLRPQFLDARMVAKQRGGLLGKLRAQRHALLGKPSDQLGIDDVGGFDRLAGLEHVADELGLGLGVGLLRARGGELGVEVAELLHRQRGVVGADQKVRFGAERLDLGIGLGDLLAHGLDFAGEPLAGAARLVLLGFLLALQISVGDGVGDFRGELGIFRQEIDENDARLLHRKDGEPVVIGFQHALFRRHRQRIFDDAEEAEEPLGQRDSAQRRIEFRQLVELELGDDFGGEIARENELDLAGHRLLIDHAAVDDILVGIGAQEDVVAADDEHARLGLIFRRDHQHHAEGDQGDDDGRAQDGVALLPKRGAEARQIEIGVDELPAQRGPRR